MPNPEPKRSRTSLIVAAALLLAAVAGMWLGQLYNPAATRPDVMGADRPAVREFSLLNADKERVTLATYRGKWVLMFFGFTTCPEACPMAMQLVTTTLQDMGDAGKDVQPVFVTIDPERDTPDALKAYLAHFADNIEGLSGTAEETAAIAAAYGVFYTKRDIAGDYTMDHSTALYLVAPDGRFVRPFRADIEPAALAAELTAAMASFK